MERRNRESVKPAATLESPAADPSLNLPTLGIGAPEGDWSELGRRVLAEATRRSMRQQRRRNASHVTRGALGDRAGRSS